ncbi:MAG: O-methyltransferase [Christensenellaceae bacterium]
MRLTLDKEYNDKGVLLWIEELPGAFTRGKTEQEALEKLQGEVQSYCRFLSLREPETLEYTLTEYRSALAAEDADSDLLFPSERSIDEEEFTLRSEWALRSARAFQTLYDSIPDHDRALKPQRRTFYGLIPDTAKRMYGHVLSTVGYYADRVGIELEPKELISDREKLLAALRELPREKVFTADDGELWTVAKVLRRLIWHDRIHAKAMARAAFALYGTTTIANPFFFRFRESVRLPIGETLAKIRLDALAEGIPTTDDETLLFLIELLKERRPKRILEIGTATGISAAVMAEVCPNAQIVTVEKREAFFLRAEELFEKLSLTERVVPLLGDAFDVIGRLAGEGETFDLIFLDGPKVQYIRYLPTLKALLAQGGTLVSDDVLLYGWVDGTNEVPKKRRSLVNHIREYLAALEADEELTTSLHRIGEGVAVSRKV